MVARRRVDRVLRREVGAENPDLYLVRPDGTELRQVTDTPDTAEYTPSWKA